MNPSPKPATAVRLNFVDALRGFAALWVVLFHMVRIPTPNLVIPASLTPLIHTGWSGVNLFFLISAFTLCYTLYGHQDDPKANQKFYLRRLFRILPLYYIWLGVMIWLNWGLHPGVFLKKSLYLYASLGFNFVPGHQQGLVMASWTLGVEMIFYLFFPFIFKVVNNLKRSIIFLCITLMLALLHYFAIKYLSVRFDMSGYELMWGLFHQLPAFAMGMVTFFVYDHLKINDAPKRLGIVLLVTGGCGLISFPYLLRNYSLINVYFLTAFYGISFIGLVIVPLKILTNRVAVFLGTISYSLYLNHPLLLFNLIPVYRYIYSLGLPTMISLIACFITTVVPLTLISYLTHNFIEKPGIELGKRVINNLTAKRVKIPSMFQLEKQF